MPEDTPLEKQIASAPHAPGCYIFRDPAATVLYVGKAKDLHARVRSYLRPGQDGRPHIYFLMERATQVEFVVVNNEKEALILENNLIKRHRPRFNFVLATDDKTFISVRMDLSHPWPRATIVHKYKRDGATYLGPFSSGGALYEAMKLLKREFQLRLCSDHVLANRKRPCVYHDIGLCCAPCVPGMVDPADYRERVEGFVATLRGRDDRLERKLAAAMEQAANEQQFERAAILRDRLFALRATALRQRAQLGDDSTADRDVIGFFREADRAMIALLCYREGKLIDSTTREFESLLPDDLIVSAFLEQYYTIAAFVPEEILVPFEVDGLEALSSWLSDKAEHRVRVLAPLRGEKARLVELAGTNARHAQKMRDDTQERERELLRKLQEAAGLENLPARIECYDISHTQGRDTVASGVCFVDGKPSKADYRRYKIKSHDTNDDFASMEEVLTRRLRRAQEEESFPDLVVIDGGPAQLSRVQKVFEALNVVGVDLISLAKSRDKEDSGWKAGYGRPQRWSGERVFLPGQELPLVLDPNSPALLLLMRIRDEAHRFAVTFHRELSRKNAIRSGLDSVAGIGPRRKKALIGRFGSPRGVKLASEDELASVPGVSRELARRIFEHFTAERAEIMAREAARAAPQKPPASA